MTTKRLREIRQRVNAATDGPWGTWHRGQNVAQVDEKGELLKRGQRACGDRFPHIAHNLVEEDGEFVAHARMDVPWMLDEIERLTKALKVMKRKHGIINQTLQLSNCKCCYRVSVWLKKERVGGYSVEAADLPGCVSQGEDLFSALANIKEAAKITIETYIAHKMVIPWTSRKAPKKVLRGTVFVCVGG